MSQAIATDPTTQEPHEQAERAFVGAMMMTTPANRRFFLRTASNPDLFADPLCRWISGLIVEMMRDGEPVDQVTIAAWAENRTLIPAPVPLTHLRSDLYMLGRDTPVVTETATIEAYAAAVRAHYARRLVQAAVTKIAEVNARGNLRDLATVIEREMYAALAAVKMATS